MSSVTVISAWSGSMSSPNRRGGTPAGGPAMLNAFYGKPIEAGRLDTKGGLGHRTTRYIATILHRAFEDAMRWGRVQRNVARLASPPLARLARPPALNIWSTDQRRPFLDFVRDVGLYPCSMSPP